MWNLSTPLFQNWVQSAVEILVSITSAVVFTFFDFLEVLMCVFYKWVDEILEGKTPSCYCVRKSSLEGEGGNQTGSVVDPESELSCTLYKRRNVFRELGFLKFLAGLFNLAERSGGGADRTVVRSRWSDCGCGGCVEWMSDGDLRLHIVVQEPQKDVANCKAQAKENVIFLHGFISSSSFWAETVFPNLSDRTKQNFRLFAVDLLGFGKSPKPRDCLYTVRDHLQMIEESVIQPFELDSFHLVAHSMGCVIALALAAKYSESVRSITLIAPPYFSAKEDASLAVLEQLAARRIWPPLLFGSSFMSWYEHLGRCVCYIICRNHQTWHWILRILNCRRNLHFLIIDLPRHTHHSAWHTMHNVVCGGAKLMDGYLEVLSRARVRISMVHGSRDQVVPIECSENIKKRVSDAEIKLVANADHCTVVLGREVNFTKDLEHIWASNA